MLTLSPEALAAIAFVCGAWLALGLWASLRGIGRARAAGVGVCLSIGTELSRFPGVQSVNSSIALAVIKETTTLPLGSAQTTPSSTGSR